MPSSLRQLSDDRHHLRNDENWFGSGLLAIGGKADIATRVEAAVPRINI